MTEETMTQVRADDAHQRLWLRDGVSVPAGEATGADPRAFHRTIPGYRETPLVDLPALATELGVASVLVKDESDRFGLPAFKALGASWAISCAIGGLLGRGPARDFAELEAWCQELSARADPESESAGVCVVTASDGNHGRALAHMAAWLGLSSRIYVPSGLPASTIDKIAGEGAEVVETDLTYDGAVALAASDVAAANADSTSSRRQELLIQDTAWDGCEEVPGWIVGGYSTLVAEVDEQLGAAPDLILVPTGVGSLLQSVVEHYRAADSSGGSGDGVGSGAGTGVAAGTRVVAVEPVTADCVVQSMAAGSAISVDTSRPTSMAGLNCGTVSELAWPVLRVGLDGAVSVTDAEAAAALRGLHDLGVAVGPCGAASLAGARTLLASRGAREHLGLSADSTIVLVSTESAAANEGLGEAAGDVPAAPGVTGGAEPGTNDAAGEGGAGS